MVLFFKEKHDYYSVVVEWQVCNPEVTGSCPTGALFEKQNSPDISRDCEVARYCAGKNHAIMAEMFSGRGTLCLASPGVCTGISPSVL